MIVYKMTNKTSIHRFMDKDFYDTAVTGRFLFMTDFIMAVT